MKKGYENELNKKQVANIFLHQNALTRVNLSPLQSIDGYNGIRGGSVEADLYNDCVMMLDPAELSVEEKNLLVLDDRTLGKQN